VCRELLKDPGIALVVVFPPVISEGPFQLAVGLRVPHRCVYQSDAEVGTKGREESALELQAISKTTPFGIVWYCRMAVISRRRTHRREAAITRHNL